MSNIKKNNISIFTEFDGIVIENHFTDYLNSLNFDSISSILTKNNIDIAINNYYIDSNFKVFADYCRNQNIELSIISDGFKELLSPVFKKINLDYIKYYANSLEYINGEIYATPYGASESCNCKNNANDSDLLNSFIFKNKSCKRNTILSNCEPENIIVYIGDGYYDNCMADYSDIIFAKEKLSAYCNKYRIPHYNFKNFFDIYRIFKEIVEKQKFKIRHQAFLNRKRAFEFE